MGVMLKWLDKRLEISPLRVAAVEDISVSRGLQSDNTTDKDGKSTKNLRGYDARKFSCSFKAVYNAGFPDVMGELESWEDLVGMYAPLYLGGRQYADHPFMLTSVNGGDVELDPRSGRLLACQIKLDFEERTENKSGAKGSGVKNMSLSRAQGLASGAANKNKSAATITASAYDRQTRR